MNSTTCRRSQRASSAQNTEHKRCCDEVDSRTCVTWVRNTSCDGDHACGRCRAQLLNDSHLTAYIIGMSKEEPEDAELLTELTEKQEALLNKDLFRISQDGEEFCLRFVSDFGQPLESEIIKILLTTDDEKYACDAMGIVLAEFAGSIEASVALNIACTTHYQWTTVAWSSYSRAPIDDIDRQLLVAAVSGKYDGNT